MRRREFIRLFGSTAVAWPLTARAQQSAIPVIGFLNGASPQPWKDYIAGFRAGLKEAGYLDGQNVTIEFRWAEGHYDRLPEMAADLVRRKVAVWSRLGVHRASWPPRGLLQPFRLFSRAALTRFTLASSLASAIPGATSPVSIRSSPQRRVSGLACSARLFREFS